MARDEPPRFVGMEYLQLPVVMNESVNPLLSQENQINIP